MTSLHRSRAYERAVRLHNRAAKCQSAGEPVRPEKLYLRSLAIKEQIFGPNHPEVGLTLNNLGLYYKTLGRLSEARTMYARTLAIFLSAYGGSHAAVADVLYNQAQLLKKESEALELRSRLVQESTEELSEGAWQQRALINHALAKFRLKAAPSTIHRFGIFAEESIPAGARMIEYTGQRVGRRLWKQRSQDRSYLLRVNRYTCLDGSVGGSGAELINHCCEPNCKFVFEGERAWVQSLRAIKTGEELLLDYHFPKDSATIACYCGAANCRGTINMR